MTPRECETVRRAKVREQKDSQRMLEINMYSMAVLIRSAVWGKNRMPEFREFFGHEPGAEPKKPQAAKQMSDLEMLAVVESLNRAFGGIDTTKGTDGGS